MQAPTLLPVICCTRCGTLYPQDAVPYICPNCGGTFDFDGPPVYDPRLRNPREPGIFQYRSSFSLPENAPTVSLGEGRTPLIPVEYQGHRLWLKMESLNPTGSYKDRGSAVLLSQLAVRSVREAVEDSSGNAGASFAAYAARAGIKARVFVPEAASGPKRGQIEAYGAELVAVPGPRSAAAEAVVREVQRGAVYASHAYLPFGLAGIATISYEIADQMGLLGEAPGTVVAPVGHGGLLLGMMRGFAALGGPEPYYVGVQAQACAPMWLAYQHGLEAMDAAEEAPTAAEGVRVRRPVHARSIVGHLAAVPERGEILAVAEEDILPAYQTMALRGVHVEPTSALVWAVLDQILGRVPEPIVLILSGAGLKYPLSK